MKKERDSSTETEEKDIIKRKKNSSRKITAITVIVVAAVIIFNLLFTAIGDAAMIYVDISQVKYDTGVTPLYTLSDTCKNLLEREAIPMIKQFNEERKSNGENTQKLKIVFCADKDIIENDSMTRYVSYTARAIAKEHPESIEVEYININKNPSAVQKYKTTSAATINSSDVIVEFGSEYLVQGIMSFYISEANETEPWAYNGEKKLSAMILSVTRAESPICCITYNHGEQLFKDNASPEVKDEYTAFIKLVEGAGYIPQFIDLERDAIPEDCRMIITFAPTEDFKAFGNLGENGVSEIEKLDKYLDEANAFFYVCNAEAPKLPNLDEYLAEWGVTVAREKDLAGNLHNYVITDSVNGTAQDGGNTFSASYATGGSGALLTADLRSRVYPPKVIFGNSARIEPTPNTYVKIFVPTDETKGTVEHEYYSYFRNGVSRDLFPIFTTYDTASSKAGEEVEIATASNRFKLMTVTHELRNVQEDNYTTVDRPSYVLALSSTDFVTNEVLESAAYGNTDVILSVLRNSGNEIIPVNIPLKSFYDYGVAEDAKGVAAYESSNPTVWFWCLTLIPPVTAFAVGAVILIRRKYK